MSIQAVSWAIEQEDIPARPALVLISIANHADHTNGYCWLNTETIAREARCTPRSVFNYVGALVRNGYIRKSQRKGEDGKQRANDYWIVFARDQKPWEWGAHEDAPETDGEATDEPSSETEAQDVVQPYAPDSHGPHAPGSYGEPVDMSQDSHGPHESRFIRYKDEPSKTNPKDSRKDAAREPFAAPPRSYKPPPVEPQGEVAGEKAEQRIFVYEGTPAFAAWCERKSRERGVAWRLTTTKIVEGKARRGWYFPSLFPPETGPPTQPTTTDDDAAVLADEFLNKRG